MSLIFAVRRFCVAVISGTDNPDSSTEAIMTSPRRIQSAIRSALTRMPAVLRDDVKAWSLESEDKSPTPYWAR